MKCIVDKSQLIRAVGAVSKCVNPKHGCDILTNLLLRFTDRLEVLGTNLTASCRVAVPADLSEEGEALVNAQTLQRILSTIKGDRIELDISKAVSIKQKGGTIKLNTTDPDKYPNLQFADEWDFRFRRQDLLDTLKLSGFALDSDDIVVFKSVAELKIFTNLIESKFEMMATNHHVLSFVNGLCEKREGVEDGSLNIPKAAVQHILAILSASSEENVSFAHNQNEIFLQLGDVDYSFHKLAVSYPDMSAAKTSDFPISFTVDAEWIKEVVQKARAITDTQHQAITFSVSEAELTVSAEGKNGSFEESVPIELTGNPFASRYNLTYLHNTLSRTSGEVEMRFAPSANSYAMRVEAKAEQVSARMFVQGLATFTERVEKVAA